MDVYPRQPCDDGPRALRRSGFNQFRSALTGQFYVYADVGHPLTTDSRELGA